MKKQFTKTLAIILSLVMLSAVVPESASAATIVDSGTCGENLTWALDDNGTLTISGTGAMSSFDSSYSSLPPWYLSYGKVIKQVIILDGVTTIGSYAFCDLINLESVTIPGSVTTIEDSAFEYCKKLQSVYITDLTKWISVNFVNHWSNPLKNKADLYLNNQKVNSVEIPFGITEITYLFEGCTSLTNVIVPSSVTLIAENAFRDCINLATIVVDEENEHFSSDEFGVLFDKQKKLLIKYPEGNQRIEYVVPDSVTNIGKGFFGNKNIQNVTLNSKISEISDYAFNSCSSLKTMKIPFGVTRIGSCAFTCSGIESIIIPDSVTSIGARAFQECVNLEKITIPDSVTEIGVWAFFNCSNLKEITLSEGISRIPDGMLEDCVSLSEIIIPEGVSSIGTGACCDCTNLKSVTIPKSLVEVGTAAFWRCSNIENVYYTGTEDKWNALVTEYNIDKELLTADIHFTEHVHTYTSVITAPTCTEKGYTTYTCACGHTYKDNEVNAKGHTYNSKITTEPTHTKEGVETFTCGTCGDSYTKAVAKLTAHTYTSVVTAPTCTAKGYTTYTCACGHTYKDNEVNAKGHTYTSKVTKQPTYTAEGVETFTCACGHSYTKAIAKLNASFTDSSEAKVNGSDVISNNGLTAAQFLSQAGKGAVIKTADGKAVSEKDLIGTGMILTLADGSKKEIVVYGDADGDGKISAADARLALRTSVGLESYKEDSCYYKAANVESNDKMSASDARLILRASVGLEDSKSWMK